jgi:crotonobetainyl-CoA:carnitine CoA-transferase CaiB-like acyl-CoA transferase
MALTGFPGAAPRVPRATVLSRVVEATAEVAELTARLGRRVEMDPGVLLTGRAALLGLQRAGRTSANGTCRLLEAGDGWVAMTLARPSDVEAVPAIIGRSFEGDAWRALEDAARTLPAGELAARAQLVGVPAARLPADDEVVAREPWRVVPVRCAARRAARLEDVVVVDLSSLWAGPVCAHLLGRAGARVIKVESTARPDGARAGSPAFFDWLHGGHESVALAIDTAAGRAALARLVARADVVIEASRPRALRQLGIDAEAVVAGRAGCTWVSITGYGRCDAAPGRVAFGDDAAVAGGLVAFEEDGRPVFASDAIADPHPGLHATLGARPALDAGGGVIVDVAMRNVVAHVARRGPSAPREPIAVERTGPDAWEVVEGGLRQAVVAPAAPRIEARAPSLGEHTATVLAEL